MADGHGNTETVEERDMRDGGEIRTMAIWQMWFETEARAPSGASARFFLCIMSNSLMQCILPTYISYNKHMVTTDRSTCTLFLQHLRGLKGLQRLFLL
jgi:hypothetical protein